MTLAELTDYVCEKSGLIEPEDQAACKDFLSKRYELIYNSYLWKDSLVAIDMVFDPVNNEDNTEGVMLLPEVIDRVVAIRTVDQAGSFGQSVRVSGLEDFYRIDFDKFSQTGIPHEFALLSPVWFVWRGLAGLQITSNAADDGQKIKVVWRDTAGKRYVQTLTLASANPALLQNPTYTDTIVVSGAGSAVANGTYTWNGQKFVSGANSIYYDAGAGVWRLSVTPIPGLIPSGAAYVSFSLLSGWSPDEADAPGPTVARGTTSEIEVVSLFKPATNSAINVTPIVLGEDAGGTMQAGDTSSPHFQRVRFFSIPQQVTTFKVLGKKQFIPLDFDQEEPEIKNLDNCLIAFAMGDMLKRARQFAKAQSELTEGAALLAELAKLETVQAAHNSRIVPEGGYGDAYFGPGTRSYYEFF